MNLTQITVGLFFFVIILLAFVVFVIKHYGSDNGRIWGYIIHYMMIIWFPIFQLIIALKYHITSEWILLVVLLLLFVPLYNLTPGKSYPSLIELKSAYNKK